MERINEEVAAKAFLAKLEAGVYPLERAKNSGIDYNKFKEDRDTEAVQELTKSKLFEKLKKMP